MIESMFNISKNTINNINVAFFLCISSLCWFFPEINNIIVILIAISIVIHLVNNKLTFSAPLLILCSIIMVAFVLSSLKPDISNDRLSNYIQSFIVFGIPGLLISQTSIDTNKVLKYIAFISIITLPMVLNLENEYKNIDFRLRSGMWMGVSYGTLNYICALIFVSYITKIKKLKIIYLIVLCGYIYLYINHASRGAVLSALIFCLLLFFIHKKYKAHSIIAISCILMIALVTTSITPLIDIVSQFFDKIGLEFSALHRIQLVTAKGGDLSNGRSFLLTLAYDNIQQHLVFGNGIGHYESLINGYVHNIFVQFIYEGGIFYFLIYFYLIFQSIFITLNRNSNIKIRFYMTYLICFCLIGLLFSNSYWYSHSFWYYIGYIICTLKTEKMEKDNQFWELSATKQNDSLIDIH